MFRRSKPNAIVASAEIVRINDRKEAQKAQRRRQVWYDEAIAYYDLVGELKFAVNWLSDKLSMLRLIPARITDSTKGPIPYADSTSTEAKAVWDAINRLSYPSGSHANLLRRLGVNWSVTGDCFLVGLDARDDEPESWNIRSVKELEARGSGGWQLRTDDGSLAPRTLTEKDHVARLWIEHPIYSELADSSVHGILSACEILLLLEGVIRSVSRNRMALNGFLKIPSELSFANPDVTQTDAQQDPFMKRLMEAITANLAEPGSASAAAPVGVRGPKDILEGFEGMAMDRPFDEEIDKLQERYIRRIAMGINIPPEILLGLGNTTQWAAWRVSEDAFTSHIEPMAVAICNALTVGYLWPALKITEPTVDAPRIWYDASKLIVRPDRTSEIKWGHEHFILSDDSTADALGFPKEWLAGKEEKLLRLLLQRPAFDPVLTEAVLRHLFGDVMGPTSARPQGRGEAGFVPMEQPGELPSTPNETTPNYPSRSHTVPTNGQPASLQFSERLLAAADAACRRAFEKAGARLRNKAQKDPNLMPVIAAVSNSRIAFVLGKERVSSLGSQDHQLIEGSFGHLKKQFELWATKSGVETTGINEAWSLLASQLSSICCQVLYDPPEDLESLLAPVIASVLHAYSVK